MERIAVFPGSFDPVTLGHVDIVQRASTLFNQLFIAIGTNINKKRLFPLDQSIEMIERTFSGNPKIKVISYDGLTVDLCKRLDANVIVRGIRNVSDFEFERSLAAMNRALNPEIETIFYDSAPAYLPISSTIIRDIINNKGDISKFVPSAVLDYI